MDTRDETVHFTDAFEHAVATCPDAGAVVAKGCRLTYRELDAWSDAMSLQLSTAVGTGPEPVMVMGAHDAGAVAAFIAVAKSGRPAVFLDTTTPVARMSQVCRLAGPVATMVDPRFAEVAAEMSAVMGTRLWAAQPEVAGPWPPRPPTYDDQVLAVVFTSGSTGEPKGVIVGDLSYTAAARELSVMGSDAPRRCGCPQPLSFIVGLRSIVRSVVTLSELHLYDPRRDGIHAMVDWVQDDEIQQLGLTPHLMRSLARAALQRGATFPSLDTVTCGGEALLASDVALMRACTSESCVIVNSFASSEGWSVSSLTMSRSHPLPASGQLPVGGAFPGREVFLLDELDQRIESAGRTGMIVIAARHLAGGYWRRPDLTGERFTRLADGRVAYRTGDLGRWDEAGALEFVSRADQMIKVRGYLVEPAEVETRLLADHEVVEGVVVGRESPQGPDQLVAYVVPSPTEWVSGAALRRRLARELPSYMVPPVIVELDVLPRNPNGKIDRRTLPEPPPEPGDIGHVDLTSMHHVIASMCCSALGLERIGKHDDLFALGADSLAAEEIVAALHSELHLEVTTATLMQNPTIAQLAELPRSAPSELLDGVVVTLAEGGAGDPVFLVAGSAGLALGFRELARQLGSDRPVYGLQAYGIEGSGIPDLTVRSTARRYVRAMRHIQPAGPYTIFGHSLGAIIVYEMTRQLTRAGNGVRLLGLLDPVGGGVTVDRKRFVHVLPSSVLHEPADEFAEMHGLTRLRARTGRVRPYLTRTFWRNLRTQRFVSYWELGLSMSRRYGVPATHLTGVRTHVFVSRSKPEPHPDWSGLIEPAPSTVLVDGDHLTMLRSPYVSQLAQAISDRLREVESSELPIAASSR